MVANHTIPLEIGPRWDVGIVSATYGSCGLVIKPGTYRREQQLIKRADVVAALQTAMADRDINFWTRVTQTDWRQGSGATIFADSLFSDSRGIDIHVPGAISAWSGQTNLDSTVAGAIGRGAAIAAAGVGGAAVAAFAWTAGNYRVSSDITNSVPTFTTYTTGGAGTVLDIVSDGTNFYFATTGTGVWTTSAAAPGNLTQYDSGANGPYHRLVWDSLRKRLFGITAPGTDRVLHQVNSGGAPTVIYDFDQGRLDAIENVFSRIYVAWNTGSAINDSQGISRVFYYDGANVYEAASGADGSQIVSLKTAGSVLWAGIVFNDIYNSSDITTPGSQFTLSYVSGGLIAGYRNLNDGRLLQNAATYSPQYSFDSWAALLGIPGNVSNGQTYFGCGPYVYKYDNAVGGVSRAFGRSTVTVSSTDYTPHIVGLVPVGDKLVALVQLLNGSYVNSGGMVWQVSGLTTPNLIVDSTDNTLASGRIDLSLPYVDKYWHGFEVVCDPIAANQQIQMEYSIDDGTTWTLCPSSSAHPNPYSTLAGTLPFFTVGVVNPHIKYRIQLRGTSGAASPVVHSVSAQFAPGNPTLKMWSFTVQARNNPRLRNNQVDDTYSQDVLDFLFDIAQENETVTFYDSNEALSSGSRVAHTVWVMQASQATINTGNTYNPTLQEGDVDLVLWETQAPS